MLILGRKVSQGVVLPPHQTGSVRIWTDHGFGGILLQAFKVRLPSCFHVSEPPLLCIRCLESCVVYRPELLCTVRISRSVSVSERSKELPSDSVYKPWVCVVLGRWHSELVAIKKGATAQNLKVAHNIGENLSKYVSFVQSLVTADASELLVFIDVLEEIAQEVGQP